MVINVIKEEDLLKYELTLKDDYTLLGLYDTTIDGEVEVETDLLAYMHVQVTSYKNKEVLVTNDGITMFKPNLVLLKVIELELMKYLNTNKVLFIETTLNNNLDFRKCGIKEVKVNKLVTSDVKNSKQYFRIYKTKVAKYLNL